MPVTTKKSIKDRVASATRGISGVVSAETAAMNIANVVLATNAATNAATDDGEEPLIEAFGPSETYVAPVERERFAERVVEKTNKLASPLPEPVKVVSGSVSLRLTKVRALKTLEYRNGPTVYRLIKDEYISVPDDIARTLRIANKAV